MINRVKSARLRREAKEAMNSKTGCVHAIYGLCYSTELGNIVEELADDIDEVKYFYDDRSFNNCIDALHNRYMACGCTGLSIYSVHRIE